MQGLKRIYHAGALLPEISITDDWHHYLKNVLRLSEGTAIVLQSDTEIGEYRILDIGKKSIQTECVSKRPLSKPAYSFTVYQCLVKREYMETVVEKYAELGVTRIVPVLAGRSQGGLQDKQRERLSSIATMAALQSENEHITEVAAPVKIDAVTACEGDNFLFYERGETGQLPLCRAASVSMIIGPEGGFTPEEVEMLTAKGFASYTPLSAILKAETAGILFAGYIRMMLERI